eukprot:6489853-Amphidinium_carterae.1
MSANKHNCCMGHEEGGMPALAAKRACFCARLAVTFSSQSSQHESSCVTCVRVAVRASLWV